LFAEISYWRRKGYRITKQFLGLLELGLKNHQSTLVIVDGHLLALGKPVVGADLLGNFIEQLLTIIKYLEVKTELLNHDQED